MDYLKALSANHPEIIYTESGAADNYEAIVFDGEGVGKETLEAECLALLKQEKNLAIDNKTQELIAGGITFDSTSFSASDNAQRNWLAIDQLRNDLGYPFGVTCAGDNEYLFQDAAQVHNFALTALGTVGAHYASGRALKLQVNACETEGEVLAIEDAR